MLKWWQNDIPIYLRYSYILHFLKGSYWIQDTGFCLIWKIKNVYVKNNKNLDLSIDN